MLTDASQIEPLREIGTILSSGKFPKLRKILFRLELGFQFEHLRPRALDFIHAAFPNHLHELLTLEVLPGERRGNLRKITDDCLQTMDANSSDG